MNETMSVTWVRDANGSYEVSSAEHVLQIMHKGTLYTDAGDAPAPTDYWAATSYYVQTSDVDLATFHEHIVPIGSSSDVFSASFDGGSYSISNWSYVNADNSLESVGLFGRCGGSTLQNIRLAGVWAVGKFGQHCGFLCGYIDGNGSIYNCEGNFEQGSSMSGETEFLYGGLGVLIGYCERTSIHGLTLRGSINVEQTTTSAGGVIGYAQVSSGGKISCVRNLATFPSGIKSTRIVGGVIAYLRTLNNTTVSNIVNVMHGDMDSNGYMSGGVIGHLFSYNGSTVDLPDFVDTIVNAMVGNISGDADSTGGIIGTFHTWSYNNKITRLANYMRGDINDGGGLIGTVYGSKGSNNHEISNSIVAMNGAADKALLQMHDNSQSWRVGIDATVNTEFGMTYNTNDASFEGELGEGFSEYWLLPGLPYLKLHSIDEKGNEYDWDFVYANVGGNPKFSAYTHASVHTGKMSALFAADFGTLPRQAITFANSTTGELFKYGAMEVVSTNATTVLDCEFPPTWVVDADGNYEVSSLEHLLQIMHKGSLYTDGGDAPGSYWGASTKFVQKGDIDLFYHHEHVIPIGSSSDLFTAHFDGSGFEIRNWSYDNSSNSVEHVGLFGKVNECTLQNIRLTGVWTMGGFGETGGLLCGGMWDSELYNCRGDFDEGTALAGGPTTGAHSGTMIGTCADSTIHGLTLCGTVDLAHSPTVRGCVIGRLYGSKAGSTVSYVRNLATFPSGNTCDSHCGGVIGSYEGGLALSNMLNAMQGDLQGGDGAGGVLGSISSLSALDTGPIDSLVNTMTGSISGGDPGGIAGVVRASGDQTTFIFTKLVNYATGNITGGGGGIFGKFECSLTGEVLYELKDSIVAMNGSVDHAVLAIVDGVPMDTVDVLVNTDFGMTFVTNDYTPATTVGEGFAHDPLFPDLPFVEFSSTDAKGNMYDWDFVYANVGGKADYSEYSHAILHTGAISAPFMADFGPLTERHLAYANVVTGELFAYGDVLVVSTDATTYVNRPFSLTWAMDANGNYEVSSVAHLVQIMHNGSRYEDEGDAPPAGQYMAASTKYIQTTSIDLSQHHGFILPIGTASNMFAASYDGDGFEIRQWAMTAFDVDSVGLFGDCSGCTLQNIRLAGVWTIGEFNRQCGFLCAKLENGGSVYNCEGHFDEGTKISGQPITTSGGLGTLIGGCLAGGSVHGLTVSGTVDVAEVYTMAGGVIGKCEEALSISRVRNLATFPSGINNSYIVGGVIGYVTTSFAISNIVNAMKGDLTAQSIVGGVIGRFLALGEGEHYLDGIVNVMTGNIVGKESSTNMGGIIGDFYSNAVDVKFTRLVNYMTGNIGDTTSSAGGGLVGNTQVSDSSNTNEISNSIVAMNGTVNNASIYRVQDPLNGGVSVVVNTDFGMTFTTNDFTPAASVGEGFLEFPMFPDLPYVDLRGTDEKGNVYEWDFVFANVGGKEKYSAYTHASIHTGKMTSPFFSDFGTLTGTHLAFANANTGELFTSGSVTAVVTDATTVLEYSLSTLATQASPIAVTTTVLPVAGAVDLKLTYQAPGGDEETAFTGFLDGAKSIEGLEPETEYTLRLYADMGSPAGYEFQEATLASTPANTAENYQVEDFVEDGEIRLDGLSSSAKQLMSAVLNELFTTGDAVRVGVGRSGRKFANAKFVNRGGTHRIKESESETIVEALLLPFDATSGVGQSVNLQLSDDSIKTVEYDDAQNTIVVDSSVYSPGDTFVIDGVKCTVFEDL